MIVDWQPHKEYYLKNNEFKTFFSDEEWPKDLKFPQIWDKILFKSKRIYCMEVNKTYEDFHLKTIEKFRREDKSTPIIIFFPAIQNDHKLMIQTLKRVGIKNIFIINDMGHNDENWFYISTSNLAWNGYIGSVPFIPHQQRPFTISALCHRFEPARWYFISKLFLSQLNKCISFSNHYDTDISTFIEQCKFQLGIEPDNEVIDCLNNLLKNSPIRPDFMSSPRFNWGTTQERIKFLVTDLSMHIRSRINLTLEGSYVDTGYGTCLQEKTGKCLATGTFPIAIGQSGTYSLLKNWGFGGFDDVKIDLSFDHILKDFDSITSRNMKIKKICSVIEKLNDSVDVEDCCKKNYEWFHDGWYQQVEKNNDIHIERLRTTLKHIC